MLDQEQWLNLSDDFPYALRQARQEGRQIPESVERQAAELAELPRGPQRETAAAQLYDLLSALPVDETAAAQEPDTLEGIQALRPQADPLSAHGDRFDQVLGGWLGRCAGCLLGQPVEGWERKRILGFLKDTRNFPIQTYFSSNVSAVIRDKYGIVDGPGPYDALHKSWSNLISCMPEDDDLNYTILSLKLLERKGREFSSEDVAAVWLTSLPLLLTCTAERVAYRNLSRLIPPPRSASYQNPYREWIGAQIRTDLYGWINPADPASAAAMAWRDGRISHTQNGLYGAMFAAAMAAAAFAQAEPRQIILQGLGQIPQHCRLADSVNQVLAWYDQNQSVEEVIQRIHRTWNEADFFDWCHVIPNAMLVAAALLYGAGDFTRTIGLAVAAGFDTDCNAATVGGILGVLLGAGKLPEQWTKPLNNRILSGVHGYHEMAITDLAERTLRLIPSADIL